jgi:ABC-2 type transport system ATP-binding protein
LELEPLLSLTEVEKTYPGKMRLGPVSMEVLPGFVYALLGPNGSGKSTLLRIGIGQTPPDRGDIRLFGRRMFEDEVAIKRRIGYMPESTAFLEEMADTVEELTDYVSRWYPDWNRARTERLLDLFELKAKQKLRGMSKGTQRRLAFVLALSHDPDLLLLDEPSSGLDPIAWGLMIKELASFMSEGGKSILLATHVMEEVRRLADYIAILHQGSLIGIYEKDELLHEWRTFWIDRMPEKPDVIPGCVAWEAGESNRIVTDTAAVMHSELNKRNVRIINSQSMEIEDILSHLIRYGKGNKRNGRLANPANYEALRRQNGG